SDKTDSESLFGIDHTNIGHLVSLYHENRSNDLLAECECLLTLKPNHPLAMFGLALVALKHGQRASAVAALSVAHEQAPREPLFPELLALLHVEAGALATACYFAKLSTALGFNEQTQALLPSSLSFAHAMSGIAEKPWLRSADALQSAGASLEATKFYDQHLTFFPEDETARRNLAVALVDCGNVVRAAEILTELQATGCLTAPDISVLARARAMMGDAEEAEQLHHSAASLAPDDMAIRCAQLADAIFYPGQTETNFKNLCRVLAPQADLLPNAGNAGLRSWSEADGPLRIGFLLMQPRDPRDLAVVALVARQLKSPRFSIYCYGNGVRTELVNAPFQMGSLVWHDARELDPATLAAIIAGDGIDVLIDIGGHAASLHVLTLSHRPARCQVSWLGNPCGALGYAIDRQLSMPEGVYVFDPLELSPRSSVTDRSVVTFGADVGLSALHADILAAWGAILEQVPGSRLALRNRQFAEPALIDRLIARFQVVGVADRIDLIDGDAGEFYDAIDVALAPFVAINPYEAVAAISRGVPLVALAGEGGHRNQAAGLLSRAGLDGFVANSVDDYVAIAVGLGRSSAKRSDAESLVGRVVRTSPVFDPDRFAMAFADALIGFATGSIS
ncbi:MAG: hypothetical protein WCK65_14625, partial [Rhodospirillaceae bacterium]